MPEIFYKLFSFQTRGPSWAVTQGAEADIFRIIFLIHKLGPVTPALSCWVTHFESVKKPRYLQWPSSLCIIWLPCYLSFVLPYYSSPSLPQSNHTELLAVSGTTRHASTLSPLFLFPLLGQHFPSMVMIKHEANLLTSPKPFNFSIIILFKVATSSLTVTPFLPTLLWFLSLRCYYTSFFSKSFLNLKVVTSKTKFSYLHQLLPIIN